MIETRQLLKARLRGIDQLIRAWMGSPPISELIYANVFASAAASLGIPLPPLYPIGAAANYSLLYLLLRSTNETPVTRVLEAGVGQTTRLLNAIAAHKNVDVISVESDEAWAARVRAIVSHPVLHCPLVKRVVHGFNVPCFDTPDLSGPFDMMLIDGPVGSRRRSRWGALEILDKYLSEEYLVIFDDASRGGELDTIQEFVRSRTRRPSTRFVHGSKSQCLVFTERFRDAMTF